MDDGRRPITKAHLVTVTGELKISRQQKIMKNFPGGKELNVIWYEVPHG